MRVQHIDPAVHDLEGEIQKALKENELVVIRGIKSITGGPLSASEYVNLMSAVGRIWTTDDELKAETKFQLPGHKEIVELRHDGLLGSIKLPWHTDASHHPARPYPMRALLARDVPQDGSAQTTWTSMYKVFMSCDQSYLDMLKEVVCWHAPAYGTGWPGRWNSLIEVDPQTGRIFVAYDDIFIKEWKVSNGEQLFPVDSALVDWIKTHIRNQFTPDIQYTHDWEPNDLLIWHNRGTVHSRTPLTPGKTRVMWRITLDQVW